MGSRMQVLFKAMRKSSASHVLAKLIASVVWACAQSMMQYLVWKGITTVQIIVKRTLKSNSTDFYIQPTKNT